MFAVRPITASDTPPSDSQSRKVKPDSGSGRPATKPYAAISQRWGPLDPLP